MQDNGTNLIFSYSMDGVNYIAAFTESASSAHTRGQAPSTLAVLRVLGAVVMIEWGRQAWGEADDAVAAWEARQEEGSGPTLDTGHPPP